MKNNIVIGSPDKESPRIVITFDDHYDDNDMSYMVYESLSTRTHWNDASALAALIFCDVQHWLDGEDGIRLSPDIEHDGPTLYIDVSQQKVTIIRDNRIIGEWLFTEYVSLPEFLPLR